MPPTEKNASVGDVETKKNAEETPNRPDEKMEPENYREVEEDAPKVKKQLPTPVGVNANDTTLNLMPSGHCNVLKPVADGGLQFLFAGARANVGVKSGRYMFEVKIIEKPMAIQYGREKASNYLKIGFSTSAADLFVGSSAHSICFDTDGYLCQNDTMTPVAKRWIHRDVVGAVLLNLDKKSPNYNTVSLFMDGVRMCKPQPLPESLHGKTLFPAVTFRNITVRTHFGPEPLAPLPFTCTMVGGAEASDVEVVAAPPKPKDGKYEVVYVPGQGGFEWLDLFLEKNPKYTELSDRALLTWCEKSGIRRKGGCDAKTVYSFGKPELPGVMDIKMRSFSRLYSTLAPFAQRDFVVMELKGNLVEENRATQPFKFPSSSFKQVAYVVVGEPMADFVKLTDRQDLPATEDAETDPIEEQRRKENKSKVDEKEEEEAEKNEAEDKKEEALPPWPGAVEDGVFKVSPISFLIEDSDQILVNVSRGEPPGCIGPKGSLPFDTLSEIEEEAEDDFILPIGVGPDLIDASEYNKGSWPIPPFVETTFKSESELDAYLEELRYLSAPSVTLIECEPSTPKKHWYGW